MWQQKTLSSAYVWYKFSTKIYLALNTERSNNFTGFVYNSMVFFTWTASTKPADNTEHIQIRKFFSTVLLWRWCTASQNTHTHPFNGPLSGTTRVSRYQKSKTNLDFTEARDGEWQRHQLGYVQVCTSLQADNHASTPQLSFYRQDALPATQPTVSNTAWQISTTI